MTESTSLEHVLWILARVKGQTSNEVLCTAPGSGSTAQRHYDEITLSLSNLKSIGSCPGGTAVGGSLSYCAGRACSDMTVRGQIDGMAFPDLKIIDPDVNNRQHTLADGSTLLLLDGLWVADGVNHGLVLVPSPKNPWFGKLVCIGTATPTKSATDNVSWQLSELSILGPCAGASSESVEMCVR